VSPGRIRFVAFLAEAFAVLLGACHEPSVASSVAPLNSAPLASPAAPSVSAAGGQGGLSSGYAGSTSEAAPSNSATPSTDAGSAGSVGALGNTIPAGDSTIALFDEQGKPLPQTEQRPVTTSAAFRQRIEAVASAIISGDAEPALASFFPLAAYQQVKDVAKPERDYKFRLLANFKRDVLEYHHALGADAARTKFDGITVSERDAKWMEPGSEGNKLGYYRVLRSHLHFTLPAGRSRDLELTSLISWRGEWYVVHLHGFK
jgi:hypothetical protein